MNEHDEDILGRFMRRFADIEREVPAPPSLAPVQSARLRTRIPVWSVAASVSMAVIAAAVIVSALVPRSTVPATGGATPSSTASVSAATETLPPPSGPVTWNLGGVSLVTPAGWHLVVPRVWTAPVGPRAFLSNVAIADPCATVFVGGDACWKPLASLPPDGILVTLSGSATLGLPGASPVVTTHRPGPVCASLGGDEEMGAGFPGFGLGACLRGPDLAAGEAAFRDLVASVKQP